MTIVQLDEPSSGSPTGLGVRPLVVARGFGDCGRSTINDLRAGPAGSPRTCTVAVTSSAA
jgi:hypothetical protein